VLELGGGFSYFLLFRLWDFGFGVGGFGLTMHVDFLFCRFSVLVSYILSISRLLPDLPNILTL
jgi:hypothetical protein